VIAVPGRGDVVARVERDVRRALQRGRNGLRYAAGTSPPTVGRTPKDVVWTRHKAQLWRYRGEHVRWRPPVVIVHSLISRSYVLDLYPGNSMVEFFLREGLDVYLLDWGVADEADAGNTLETYADGYIPQGLAAIEAPDVTLLGYCFGGVLSLLACTHNDLPVRNLVLMATPVDFSGMQAMTALVREGRLEPEELLDDTGNVPPEAVENAFRLLKPTAEYSQYATLWDNLWNDAYMEGYQAMGQWTRDHVPFPGAAFRQTVNEFVRGDALLDGRLRAIGCPVLNVMAERDHIVPPAAAEPLADLIPQAEELRLAAGHVGLVAGRAAAKVTLPGIVRWIRDHSEPL
jgi:polyhydroxyalkanoate synthase